MKISQLVNVDLADFSGAPFVPNGVFGTRDINTTFYYGHNLMLCT